MSFESNNMFNVQVNEIDNSCPLATQPQNMNVKLKPHQLSLLYSCKKFEESFIVWNESKIKTFIGVIGDRVGSGKSFVVLALISSGSSSGESLNTIRTFASNHVILHTKKKEALENLNLLVVPHNLVQQWTTYLRSYFPNLRVLYLTKSKGFNNLYETDLNILDLLVVSSTLYNRVAKYFSDNKIRLKRVFFDEADSINISSCEKVESDFYWFVTASFSNLLYPRGFNGYDMNQRKYIMHALGIRNTGFLKNIFIDLASSTEASQLARVLVLKNSDDFINESIHLPEPITNFILCRTPVAINVLNGLVDKYIIDCLVANDIESALEYVNPYNRTNEENIIKCLIRKLQKQVKNIELRLEYIQQVEYDTESERQHETKKWEDKIIEINRQMTGIKERIQSNNACCICYDELQKKTIVPCCSNSFCFKCIQLWLSKSNKCPLCAKMIERYNLYVVEDTNTEIVEFSERIHESNDKLTNLRNLLLFRLDENSKILIFSLYENTFLTIGKMLNENNVKYAYLKGNMYQINNTIQNYKDNDIRVLFVNSRNYGSGLNLENTTDVILFHKFDSEIEKQVIGRAQRYGRTQPLRIWYLLYNNEYHPSLVE